MSSAADVKQQQHTIFFVGERETYLLAGLLVCIFTSIDDLDGAYTDGLNDLCIFFHEIWIKQYPLPAPFTGIGDLDVVQTNGVNDLCI